MSRVLNVARRWRESKTYEIRFVERFGMAVPRRPDQYPRRVPVSRQHRVIGRYGRPEPELGTAVLVEFVPGESAAYEMPLRARLAYASGRGRAWSGGWDGPDLSLAEICLVHAPEALTRRGKKR